MARYLNDDATTAEPVTTCLEFTLFTSSQAKSETKTLISHGRWWWKTPAQNTIRPTGYSSSIGRQGTGVAGHEVEDAKLLTGLAQS